MKRNKALRRPTPFPKTQAVFNPGRRTRMHERRRRPVSNHQSMHIVIRSDKARGAHSLRKHAKRIERMLELISWKYGVHIVSMANVGNHIHIALRLSNCSTWRLFISGLTGGIVRAVGYFRKQADDQPFWNARPFTRIVSWGRAYEILKDYITLNKLEALDVLPGRRKGQRMNAQMRQIVRRLKVEYNL